MIPKKVLTPFLVLIFLTWIFGFALRFYQLGAVPIALNRDEASLGYAAYSIAMFGHDEHGRRFPINIESFGDWKLAGYVYAAVPFIKLFGLSEWSIRLPSALSSAFTVIVVSLLFWRLLPKQPNKKILIWLGTFFFAVSPWSLHFSHVAYEANLALFFFSVATFFLTESVFFKRQWLLILSSFFYSLTLYTYHSYQLVTPVFLLFFAALFSKKLLQLFQKNKVIVMTASVAFVLAYGLLLLSQRSGANETKFQNISIFSETLDGYNRSITDTILVDAHPLLRKMFASQPIIVFERLSANFYSLFNPEFLFIRGGSHNSHNVSGLGNLYRFAFITVLIGSYLSIRQRQPWQKLLGIWLLAAAVPPLFTYANDLSANHSTRFSAAIVPLELISATGAAWLVLKVTKLRWRAPQVIVLGALAGLVGYATVFFIVQYFVINPDKDAKRWPWYMKDIVQIANTEGVDKQIYLDSPSSSPYIYFLFYNPAAYQPLAEMITYFPATSEGFRHVKELKNAHFVEQIDFNDVQNRAQPALVVVTQQKIPADLFSRPGFREYTRLEKRYDEQEWVIVIYEPSTP